MKTIDTIINSTNTILTLATAAAVFLGKTAEQIKAVPGGEKLFDEIGNQLSKVVIGSNTEEAAKTNDDEIFFEAALNTLSDPEIEEAESFGKELRKKDKEKEAAFVLYVAKIVEKYIRKTTTIQPKKNKDDNKPKETIVWASLEQGAKEGGTFIKKVIAKKCAGNEPETFKMREDFLELKHVFDLIKKKKDPNLVSQGVDLAKKDLSEGAKELSSQMDNLANWLDSKLKK